MMKTLNGGRKSSQGIAEGWLELFAYFFLTFSTLLFTISKSGLVHSHRAIVGVCILSKSDHPESW